MQLKCYKNKSKVAQVHLIPKVYVNEREVVKWVNEIWFQPHIAPQNDDIWVTLGANRCPVYSR